MGAFFHTRGYELIKVATQRHWYWFAPTIIYRVELPKDCGTLFTYRADDGTLWRAGFPGLHYETDMGSVPWLATCIVGKDEFLLSFMMHDAAWKFGGLWSCRDGHTWLFSELTRYAANVLLREMVEAEGCGAVRAQVIFEAVEVGAVCIPDRHERPPQPAGGMLAAGTATAAYGWSEISDAQNSAVCRAIKAHVAADPKCEWCGNIRVVELTAHHVVPIHADPSRCCDDANLVTLCARTCHLTVGHLNAWQRINTALIPQLSLQPKGIP